MRCWYRFFRPGGWSWWISSSNLAWTRGSWFSPMRSRPTRAGSGIRRRGSRWTRIGSGKLWGRLRRRIRKCCGEYADRRLRGEQGLPAQTLRLDRTKLRGCSAAELAASIASRTQLQTVLAVRFADRICLPSVGALAFAIRDVGPTRLASRSILLQAVGGGRRVKAKIHVTLKQGILDPQGKAIEHALETLGFKSASNVRVGKYLELDLKETDKAKAEVEVKSMCEKLLANTIIEEYRYELQE